jgi:hypothetical protein
MEINKKINKEIKKLEKIAKSLFKIYTIKVLLWNDKSFCIEAWCTISEHLKVGYLYYSSRKSLERHIVRIIRKEFCEDMLDYKKFKNKNVDIKKESEEICNVLEDVAMKLEFICKHASKKMKEEIKIGKEGINEIYNKLKKK